MAVSIELFYDCLSPFSYLAFTVLERYQPVWGVDLRLRPLLLGGVMGATKNLPPMARPWSAATQKVSDQDMTRNKAWFNVPQMLDMPANFFGPKGPSDPSGLAYIKNPYQRTLALLARDHPSALRNATRLVFESIWANPSTRDSSGKVMMTLELLHRICTESGLSAEQADAVMAHIDDKEVVGLLKGAVGEAVKLGAYGAPFMVVRTEGEADEQVYFGSDRFEVMAFRMAKPWHGPDPTRVLPWHSEWAKL